jgi:hypothetical protein
MTAVRWRPPPGTEADSVALWLCAAARRLVPQLGAKSHAVVHAVAGVLADDLAANGRPPIELTVEAGDDELAICVTDGRDCTAKLAGLHAQDGDEIRPLTRSLTVTPTTGHRGCTLRTVVPVRAENRRTLRSRLLRRRGGRP